MYSSAAITLGVVVCALLSGTAHVAAAAETTCKCIPGDDCWPSAQEWADFNTTVGGKLVVPRQLASVCHNPDYDEAACNYVRKEWTQPWLHDDSSSSIMAAAVSNGTCDPFSARELPCDAGEASLSYSVNATDSLDFARAIAFAHDKNIRLVIRNTGHDYLGKSSGKWALSVWTHYMKKTEYMPQYNGTGYTGAAIRLGAGIQVEEAYMAGRAQNKLVVGGDCDTVGVVGGYLQGGGHSALSSLHGMGADSVLEWEVVDGTGRLLTASPQQNADLYWALSGGGGGTYGIVTSVVVKLHDDVPVTGVVLQFDLDPARPEAFWDAVSKYHEMMPSITAAKGMGIALITGSTFFLTPLTFPNLSRGDAETVMAPLMQKLNDQGVAYSLQVTEHPNWLTYWQQLIKPNPTQLVQNGQYGGWMVPRTLMANNYTDVQAAIKEITDAGCVFVGLALDVSHSGGSGVENSVLPAWRDAAMNVILSTAWPEGAKPSKMKALADTMTQTCVPALSRMAPDAGAYLNEADPNQPNWQKAFYGANYDKLVAIKNKYDPYHIFYATTAVGSDYYTVDSAGRLCSATTT
ncbi:isoamyl alcohol oxidase [Bombardia bombarda]|uniref:Isoamyl alcohol oxidase n=1 Tax=Bombardia bombarda TaxID=252184 RepID=A0AA39XIL3_9PEZI|nr:isoamyl alcohol oxidase [Bombardia bombarda]